MKNGTVLLLVLLGLVVGMLIGRLSVNDPGPPSVPTGQEPMQVLSPTIEHDLCVTQIDGHVRIERCSRASLKQQPIFL